MEKILIDLDLRLGIHTTAGNTMLEVKLKIPEFGFISLYGKSGAGKTSTLRMIAGLVEPEAGFLNVDGVEWFNSKTRVNLKTRLRDIGFAFQDYALFPNMTVKEHLLFAQQTADNSRADELLEIFHLTSLYNRRPGTLSGGQKQRLSVARALARRPRILLLDEPLSALDMETRLTLQEEIMLAHKNFKATTILVSHDLDEIIKLSDHVYVIDNGRIINHGAPAAIFPTETPNGFVAADAVIKSINNKKILLCINGVDIETDAVPGTEHYRQGDKVRLEIKH